MDRFYSLPDELQTKIFLLVHAALLVELHEELMSKKDNLWSYYGRWAFLAADEFTESDTSSQYDYNSDPNYCDGECCVPNKGDFWKF